MPCGKFVKKKRTFSKIFRSMRNFQITMITTYTVVKSHKLFICEGHFTVDHMFTQVVNC